MMRDYDTERDHCYQLGRWAYEHGFGPTPGRKFVPSLRMQGFTPAEIDALRDMVRKGWEDAKEDAA